MTTQQISTQKTVAKSRLAEADRPKIDQTPALRPPLKWAGGKRWQLPYLRPLWKPHATRRLVEPFCGGLAVTLGLRPQRALLNDVNTHVIHFYQWLKRGLVVSLEMRNDDRQFYANRDHFNELLANGGSNTSEAAALFYYLNRTGYNGLCRFNQKGHFNVPFGRYKQIGYTTDFTAYREVFANWSFMSADCEAVPLRPVKTRRLYLCRPAVRRRVHALCQGRIFLGGSSQSRTLAESSRRSCGFIQSSHEANRAALQSPRVHSTVSASATDDQLHG